MKRLLALALLLPAPAMAQQPSPAQVGITTAVPNVVQVYDSSHNWATIGTVDPVTHLFTAANLLPPYVLPTASTTTLGGVKVDGSTININGSGVISGTPPAITANSTPTSGFAANQLLKSDGTKVQPVVDTDTLWTSNPGYPVFVGAYSTNPSVLRISGTYGGLPYNGIGLGVWTNGAGAITLDNIPGYSWLGFTTTTHNVSAPPDAGMWSKGPGDIAVSNLNSSTAPIIFRAYNTYTDASNGEWGALDWKTTLNTLTIGTQANGTGTQRPVNIVGNPVTVNGAAVPNGIITAGTTPTSGFTAGKLLYSDGTKVQSFGDTLGNLTGNPAYPLYVAGISYANPTLWLSGAYAGIGNYGMGLTTYNYGDAGVSLDDQNGNSFFGFLTATNTVGSSNTGIMSQGYGIINIRSQTNPTSPQQLRVANTWTDASNGEWGGFDWATTSNVLTVGTGHNGTGAARPMNLVASALQINGVAAVSCAAGTVNAATMVVTNGIITHC